MSSTAGLGNIQPVGPQSLPGSASPTSNSSNERKNRKRTAPENSVSLRHGRLSQSAAEPFKQFVVPPKLQHGNPGSHRGSSASSNYRPTGGLPRTARDMGVGIVDGQAVGSHDTDRESAFNSNGSNDRSVPEDWFKSWNNNVGDFNKPNYADGDSPYYLPSEQRQRRRQKSRATGQHIPVDPKAQVLATGPSVTFGPQPGETVQTQVFNPSYPPMLPTQDSEDESDVYRSVIDDLTIKNKKLKKKLRKMERLHCSELNEEKLFEVRCYGLPPSRKQELQELLQKFAADMEGNGGVYETKRTDVVSNANATLSTNPSSTNPSATSLLQNTDSAYATETRMTSLDGVSADVSKAKSMASQLQDKQKGTPMSNQDIKSIPFANERMRMKLVIRRLEQLFTGRDALLPELEKARAQQQVAVAASREKHDSAVDDCGNSGDEGSRREASMMSTQQDDDLRDGRSNVGHTTEGRAHRRSLDTSHQRPTRPMDLDPNRALVPSDNVEYLEHMSLSSSSKIHNFKTAVAGESTDWVYLNLINNLAQIHTLNVSLSFIKQAIRLYSDKLELSSDGNKVRWRGGLTGTRLSSDGDSSGLDNSSAGESSPNGGSADKSPGDAIPLDGKSVAVKPSKSAKRPSSRISKLSSPAHTSAGTSAADKFRYRPLVFHSLTPQKSSPEDSSEQDGSESSSDSDSNNTGGPPLMVESGSNLGLTDIGKFAPVDGPIIYFGGAAFCTDLSAQIVFREGGHNIPGSGDARSYERFIEDPIGVPHDDSENDDPQNSNRSPLNMVDWSAQDTEMDLAGQAEERLPQLTSIVTAANDILPAAMPSPIGFPVSGLGGVRPEDNFVVYVRSKQRTVPMRKIKATGKRNKIHHSIPLDTLKAFTLDTIEEQTVPHGYKFENEMVDAIQIRLTPSKLPDPTFAISYSEESSDPMASTSDEMRSYESHLSFAYNIESDSRSSGEGIPSFHSPDLDDRSPMDLDAEDDVAVDQNPLAPLSVVATAGDLSQDGSEAGSVRDMPIVQPMGDMDIGNIDI